MISAVNTGYLDQNCTVLNEESDVSGSLVFPGGAIQTTLGTANHLDVTLESLLVDGVPLRTARNQLGNHRCHNGQIHTLSAHTIDKQTDQPRNRVKLAQQTLIGFESTIIYYTPE